MSGSAASAVPPPAIQGYEYVRTIGSGGFADVHLYRHGATDQEVAIKVLRSVPDEEARRRFTQEAMLMAKLAKHPFVVDVHTAGTASDGRPYLVMKYWGEASLEDRAKAQGLLGVAEVLDLGVKVASAVHNAHQAQVLHRDIKPANVLLDEFDTPGLTDFGMAGTGEDNTAQTAVSAQYTAPEVHRYEPADVRSDIYAMAATLYRLLAGRPPFYYRDQPNDPKDVVPRVLHDPVPSMGVLDVPPALEILIRQGLAKDPGQRPRDAAMFAQSLRDIQRAERLVVTPFVERAAPITKGRDLDEEDRDRTALGSQVVAPHSARAPVQPPLSVSPLSQPQDDPTDDRTQGRDGRVIRPEPDAPAPDEHVELAAVPDVERQVSPPADAATRRHLSRLALAGVGLVLVVAIAVVLAGQGEGEDEDVEPEDNSAPTLVLSDLPDVPTDVTIRVEGEQAVVEWDPGSAEAGDSWILIRTDDPEAPPVLAEEPTAAVPVAAGEEICVTVSAIRDGQQSDPSSPPACVSGA